MCAQTESAALVTAAANGLRRACMAQVRMSFRQAVTETAHEPIDGFSDLISELDEPKPRKRRAGGQANA